FELWAVQVIASGLVSNVPLAPVATKASLGKATLYRSLVVLDACGVHVTRSALMKIFPPLPTATYRAALETRPKARLFILTPALGMEGADVQAIPSLLVTIEPSVPSAMNWLPEDVTALRSLANPAGTDVACVHAVTPGGFELV